MTSNPIIVIGIGEMGSVFSRSFLRIGYTVIPAIRGVDLNELALKQPQPELVLVAVTEKDIDATLKKIPLQWKNKIALLQNELLPDDWQKHEIENPTVLSVWFEKKKGQDSKVLIPTPVYGPQAQLFCNALKSIDITGRTLNSEQELLDELILKNIYIVCTNVCGLITGGTVGELWENHETLCRQVANEVMDIQESLTGITLNRNGMIEKMLAAFRGDNDHKCMGRSAGARLQRALAQAANAGIEVAKLAEIKTKAG